MGSFILAPALQHPSTEATLANLEVAGPRTPPTSALRHSQGLGQMKGTWGPEVGHPLHKPAHQLGPVRKGADKHHYPPLPLHQKEREKLCVHSSCKKKTKTQ